MHNTTTGRNICSTSHFDEKHPRQSCTCTCALGVLCCFALFVCLTFLPSHLSFKNMYYTLCTTIVSRNRHVTYMYMYVHIFPSSNIVIQCIRQGCLTGQTSIIIPLGTKDAKKVASLCCFFYVVSHLLKFTKM